MNTQSCLFCMKSLIIGSYYCLRPAAYRYLTDPA